MYTQKRLGSSAHQIDRPRVQSLHLDRRQAKHPPALLLDSTLGGVTFKSDTYDQLIQETRTTHAADQEARLNDFAQAQDILVNQETVLAPIYNRSISVLANQKIKDLYWHSFGPTYSLKWAYVN